MKRGEILDTAKSLVDGDRAQDYGPPSENFGNIAALWSAYLGVPINLCDVAVLMTLMKLARLKTNQRHADSWIDGCGYLALGGELSDIEK